MGWHVATVVLKGKPIGVAIPPSRDAEAVFWNGREGGKILTIYTHHILKISHGYSSSKIHAARVLARAALLPLDGVGEVTSSSRAFVIHGSSKGALPLCRRNVLTEEEVVAIRDEMGEQVYCYAQIVGGELCVWGVKTQQTIASKLSRKDAFWCFEDSVGRVKRLGKGRIMEAIRHQHHSIPPPGRFQTYAGLEVLKKLDVKEVAPGRFAVGVLTDEGEPRVFVLRVFAGCYFTPREITSSMGHSYKRLRIMGYTLTKHVAVYLHSKGLVVDDLKGIHVDHVSGNPHDNRISNLVGTTRALHWAKTLRTTAKCSWHPFALVMPASSSSSASSSPWIVPRRPADGEVVEAVGEKGDWEMESVGIWNLPCGQRAYEVTVEGWSVSATLRGTTIRRPTPRPFFSTSLNDLLHRAREDGVLVADNGLVRSAGRWTVGIVERCSNKRFIRLGSKTIFVHHLVACSFLTPSFSFHEEVTNGQVLRVCHGSLKHPIDPTFPKEQTNHAANLLLATTKENNRDMKGCLAFEVELDGVVGRVVTYDDALEVLNADGGETISKDRLRRIFESEEPTETWTSLTELKKIRLVSRFGLPVHEQLRSRETKCRSTCDSGDVMDGWDEIGEEVDFCTNVHSAETAANAIKDHEALVRNAVWEAQEFRRRKSKRLLDSCPRCPSALVPPPAELSDRWLKPYLFGYKRVPHIPATLTEEARRSLEGSEQGGGEQVIVRLENGGRRRRGKGSGRGGRGGKREFRWWLVEEKEGGGGEGEVEEEEEEAWDSGADDTSESEMGDGWDEEEEEEEEEEDEDDEGEEKHHPATVREQEGRHASSVSHQIPVGSKRTRTMFESTLSKKDFD